MFKKITILLLILITLYSCSKEEKEVIIDNGNNGVIIDSKNKVEKLGVGLKGDSSTVKVNGGFNN